MHEGDGHQDSGSSSEEEPPNAELNKYGFTTAEWVKLTRKEKGAHYQRCSRDWLRAIDPEKYRAKMSGRRRRRRERHVEITRERELRRYYANHENRLASSRACYYRHHEKQLARGKARTAKDTSISKTRRSPDEVYKLIAKAVPASLPRHDRDDLIGTMCLAILEGQLLVKNIKASVRKYLAAHNRDFDGHKTLSLDTTMPGSNTTWVSQLTEDDLPWGKG